MTIQIGIENYRRLRRIRWSPPKGVSLLVGPNGSGKSTLLKALLFVSDYLGRDLEKAIELSGGPWGLKRLGADEESPVRFRFTAGELEWLVELQATHRGWSAREQVTRAGALVPEQHAGARGQLEPILTPLEYYRLHENPNLGSLRGSGSPEGPDDTLDRSGANAFTVLRNWASGTREQNERYAFVEEGLKAAFPHLITGLVLRSVSGSVVADFCHPDHEAPLPSHAAPKGLLAAVIHLVAVAAAPARGVVAIDGFENDLHPTALSSLLERIRDRADEQALTVVLASYSLALMNEFNEDKARVFVLEVDQGQGEWPVPLTEAVDRDWLAHFAPGDRYGRDYAKQPTRG